MGEMPRYYRFEGFRLDTLRRELRDTDGAMVPLTSKAFDVLCVLIENRHVVVGKQALLDAVWPGRVVEENNLTQAIAALRRAFDTSAQDHRFIVTVPGRGYRFVAAVAEELEAVPHVPEPPPPQVRAPEPSLEPAEARANEALPGLTPASAPSPEADAVPVASPPPAADTPRRRRLLLLAGALLVVAVGGVGWLWLRPQPMGADAVPTPTTTATATATPAAVASSIAVLPLVNASQDQAQQFFSDGLSENLINTLASFDGLKVIGSSSSFRFRDSREGSHAIGAKLGAAYLLSGSVQRAGEHVRVSVEVVDTSDGHAVYAQQFDRPYQDLFALQDDIASAVAGALLGKLPHVHSMVGVVETGRPASGNLEAYNAFLRGAHAMLSNNRKAMDEFAAAVRLDPGYAQAWLWLGFSRAISARYLEQGEAMRASCARAREEIETAIRLAPDYGLGYSALAVQRTSCDYDWKHARELFDKALPLVSVTSPIHGQYSRLLASLGQVNKAIDERNRHLAADPLTEDGIYWLQRMQASLGRLDDAETSLRRLQGLSGAQTSEWYPEAQSYLSLLRGDQAAALAQARAIAPGGVRDRAVALVLQAGDNVGEADAALQRLIENEGRTTSGGYHIARAYALRGDADAMFDWLDRDWARHGVAVYQILFDPLLLRFRDDPRFAAFCARAGLPAPETSEALSIDRIQADIRGAR